LTRGFSAPRLGSAREKNHWHDCFLPEDYFRRLKRDTEQVEKSAEKTRYVPDDEDGATPKETLDD
jgi:hypothetical protein